MVVRQEFEYIDLDLKNRVGLPTICTQRAVTYMAPSTKSTMKREKVWWCPIRCEMFTDKLDDGFNLMKSNPCQILDTK